ncbi:hypothetical protein [Flavobacterium sp.]|jgi:hypothetical protein|uniref:hypothetical protein n=1 Tax=Flavobacterium sp. TaxID=239 RepID=UPI0037C1359B
MSTVELQNLLISKISKIDDEAFLTAINTVLDEKSENIENYNLDLQKSEEDIRNGNTNTHKQVLDKIALWKKR